MRIQAQLITAQVNKGKSGRPSQDCVAVDEKLGLYVVSDGVSHCDLPVEASRMSCNRLIELIRDKHLPMDRLGLAEAMDILRQAIIDVNQEVARLTLADRKSREATLSAVWIVGGYVVSGHLGDSRIYLSSLDGVDLLSRDQTMAWETYVEHEKSMTPEQYYNAPQNGEIFHTLTQCIGAAAVTPVMNQAEIVTGDRILITSDGMLKTIPHPEVARWLRKKTPAPALAREIANTCAPENRDDLGFILMEVSDIKAIVDERTGPLEVPRELRHIEKHAALNQISFFEGLPKPARDYILGLGEVRFFAEGETILKADDEADSLYLILAGVVEVFSRQGKFLEELSGPRCFGENSLSRGGARRMATVKAKGQVTTIRIHKDKFPLFQSQNKDLFVEFLLRVITDQNRKLEEKGVTRPPVAPRARPGA